MRGHVRWTATYCNTLQHTASHAYTQTNTRAPVRSSSVTKPSDHTSLKREHSRRNNRSGAANVGSQSDIIWIFHVPNTNESCPTHKLDICAYAQHSRRNNRAGAATVVSQSDTIWMRHVQYTNESCLTYEWVMSHIWTNYVSRTHEKHMRIRNILGATAA